MDGEKWAAFGAVALAAGIPTVCFALIQDSRDALLASAAWCVIAMAASVLIGHIFED
jgi:hypothetical protein